MERKLFTALFAAMFLTCFTFGLLLIVVSRAAACGFFALTLVAGAGAVIADSMEGKYHD